MTDLFLIGIFILCIVTGYILVKRSGGFLELMLFHNPEMWYNLDRDYTSAGSLSSKTRQNTETNRAHPPEKRSVFGHDTAQELNRTKMPESPEKRSFFERSTTRKPKDFKAGI